MRKFAEKTAVLIAATLALSGCQSIFGARMARVEGVRPASSVAGSSAATEEGRRYLDQAQLGLAAEAFQRALAGGEPPAPALNGLGVVYAQLGRYETAQRLFQEAMAIEPANDRYAANLARLNRSPAFAMRHDGDVAAALTPSAPPASAPTQTAQKREPEQGRLTRVSGHEFRIRTLAPSPAPLRSAGADITGFKPLARIQLTSPAMEAPLAARKVSRVPAAGAASVKFGFQPIVRLTMPPAKPSEPSKRAEAVVVKKGSSL